MRRQQRFPAATGELLTFGQVWIVESLDDHERHTGRALSEHLTDLTLAHNLDIWVRFRSVRSAEELLTSLDDLLADIAETGRYAILDIECHGLDDFSGLRLNDGSHLLWDALKPRLQAINLASRFNLFLILACCNGGYFGQISRLEELSAVCAYLGPNANLPGPMLLEALSAFFTTLLTERDVTAAFTSVVKSVPNFPYFFSTAMGIFRLGAIGYVRDLATGKPLRDRARQLAARFQAEGKRPVPSINALARALKENERPYFERCIRSFFALDALPENSERFPISYEEIVHAAARSRRN